MKKCYRCGRDKPLAEYSKSSGGKDGLHSYCRSCQSEYASWRKKNPAQKEKLPEGFRRCYRCLEVKLLEEFSSDIRVSNPSRKRYYCKPCSSAMNREWRIKNHERRKEYTTSYRENNKDVMAERSREWRSRNKEKISAQRRGYMMKRLYGLEIKGYDGKLKDQGFSCAICHRQENGGKPFFVDHDHETGLVRGLLCSSCNFGLGGFRDSPELLVEAAAYINRHKKAKENVNAVSEAEDHANIQ